MYINNQLQTITVPIPGKYTVYNAVAAVSATSMLGAQMQDVLVGLSGVKVPGRSEIVDINKTFAVLIGTLKRIDSVHGSCFGLCHNCPSFRKILYDESTSRTLNLEKSYAKKSSFAFT